MDTSSTSTAAANDHHQSTSISALKNILQQVLRITVLDGRIFLGTFVGTDQMLNVLLANAEEFRIGPNENPNGRYVGQVMIPWKLVVKAEAQVPSKNRDRPNESTII
jgi:N-alpha-acetyltransferase 38, NatC auxiliary subunit